MPPHPHLLPSAPIHPALPSVQALFMASLLDPLYILQPFPSPSLHQFLTSQPIILPAHHVHLKISTFCPFFHTFLGSIMVLSPIHDSTWYVSPFLSTVHSATLLSSLIPTWATPPFQAVNSHSSTYCTSLNFTYISSDPIPIHSSHLPRN